MDNDEDDQLRESIHSRYERGYEYCNAHYRIESDPLYPRWSKFLPPARCAHRGVTYIHGVPAGRHLNLWGVVQKLCQPRGYISFRAIRESAKYELPLLKANIKNGIYIDNTSTFGSL